MEPEHKPREGGVAALSPLSRGIVAVALASITVLTVTHLAMIFFHVAPSNTVSKRHGELIDSYVYPEFEQNWKLFAPNPLQTNIAVQARAQVRYEDGTTRTTRWVNLSAMDGENIRGNLFPSHTVQNELRRAWSFYTGSHDSENKATGIRGTLSEQYLRRIVMLRFGPRLNGGEVEQIQLRSASVRVAPPAWSEETADIETEYQVLPWWGIDSADLQSDDRARVEARNP